MLIEKIHDVIILLFVVGLFVIIMPFFFIAYKLVPNFAKALDDLYANDPILSDPMFSDGYGN